MPRAVGWTARAGARQHLHAAADAGITRRARLARGAALLYPITAYFLAFSPRQRAAARLYLGRALGPACRGWRDLFRLYFAFASTILDRVWL